MSVAGMTQHYGLGSIAQIPVRHLGTASGDGDGNHNFYHLRNTWNSTEEYLMVLHTDPAHASGTVALHNGLSGAWIKDLWNNAQYDWRGCWSKVLPNIWYTWSGGTVYVRDVETNINIQSFQPAAGNSILPTGPVINLAGNRIFLPTGDVTTHYMRTYDLDPVTGFITSNANDRVFSYNRVTGSPVFYPQYASPGEDKYLWSRDGDKLVLITNAFTHNGNTRAASTNTTEVFLGTGASTASGAYVNNLLQLRPSPFLGQQCRIVAYDGPNQMATVASPGFVQNPGANVAYMMEFNRLTILQQDGTLISHLQSGGFGHGDYLAGNYMSLSMPLGTDVPLRIWAWKENTVDPLLIFTAGGNGSLKSQKTSNIHVTFADNVTDKLFVSVFPYYGTGFYPYPGGTYVKNQGGAWNSADSETNTHAPYDEIFYLKSNDNWTTQGGITVKYLCRTNTRSFNPGVSNHSGIAQANVSSTQIVLASDASTTDGIYVGNQVRIAEAPWNGEVRVVTAYTYPVATVDQAFSSAPGAGVAYAMLITAESFWCQPQHAVNKYGTRLHFNARDST